MLQKNVNEGYVFGKARGSGLGVSTGSTAQQGGTRPTGLGVSTDGRLQASLLNRPV